ncbi:MAG: virulence RhuM family protein [Hyphomicrobiaceae bacterium]|nr:virulence RhuM family protein [Hyphomicrobiaceae bacterium]
MINDGDEPIGKAKGGHARAEKLPPERRSEIAKQAAEARWKAEPVELVEDVETGDRFILYTKPDGVEFQLRFDGEEPWATQKQIADLMGVTRSVVTRHIKNIFNSGEIDADSNVQKTNFAGSTKPTALYSLDVILAVGYRAGSKEAMLFRRWATDKLRQYLLNGFVIDTPRMKDPERNDRLEELLEIIEEIRASEANVWRQILNLITYCSDYHAMTRKEKENYFATFQNAMHWAVASATAAEIRHDRIDASKPYAGLTHFEGEHPTVADGKVAKNFLGQDEIKRLNMITNLALNFLKSQAEQGRLVAVAQYTDKLREIVQLDGRPLIPRGHLGSVSADVADKKVSREIAIYKKRIELEEEAEVGTSLENILAKARQIVDAKRGGSKSTSSAHRR